MNNVDKVAIVTGSNVGIGLATATGLARAGYQVVLACRDEGKAKAAQATIEARVPGARVAVGRLDLASIASVRAFAAWFEASYPRLDVLVHNAAIVPSRRVVTEDGHEAQLQVNHLGPFLLTQLLLGRLRSSTPSRVVVVSSSVHDGAKLDWDDLEAESGYSTMKVYARSKLLNLLFVRALARRLSGSGVTVNALHPGVVNTELARDFPLPFRLLAKLFFATPEKGARTSLFLALDASVDGVSGGYFADRKPKQPSAAAQDDAAAERLWQLSEKMVAEGAQRRARAA